LWDPVGTALANWKPKGEETPGGALAFSPDGRLLVAPDSDKTVYLLDGRTLRERGSFRPHPRSPIAFAFSPDGKRLVTGGNDRLVKIWDVAKLLDEGAPKK
jgi:WD40 repeat protein